MKATKKNMMNKQQFIGFTSKLMENSNDKPCKPGCKNASSSKKPTTIKQHITLSHYGPSSSTPTNPPAGSACPYISNYIQPADTSFSTIIQTCSNERTDSRFDDRQSGSGCPDDNRAGKPSKEKINIVQTVDIVVKPKNSQLVNVDIIPSNSQEGNGRNMIIPIQLQFCPDTCPKNEILSKEVTVLHETSKCSNTKLLDANLYKTETPKPVESTKSVNFHDTDPRNKKFGSEVPGHEESINKSTTSTERQPTRYCFDNCPKKSKPVQEDNDKPSKVIKSGKTTCCSIDTCPKKSKSTLQNESNDTSIAPKIICPDTCPKKRKTLQETSQVIKICSRETCPKAEKPGIQKKSNNSAICKEVCPATCPKGRKPPHEPLENVKKNKRTHLLYKVCKPELEQYIAYGQPCEETASATSEESAPIEQIDATESVEEVEEVRSVPWYGVLHECQFQEAYTCDDCAIQESVEVQTELVLGENLFSQSLNSVTDTEHNKSERTSHHTLEIDTFFLPPTGTFNIVKVAKKSDLPDIDKIISVEVKPNENRVKENSTNTTDKKEISPKKKKTRCSPCCIKQQQQEEEEEEKEEIPYVKDLPPSGKIDFLFATNCSEHEPYNQLLSQYFPALEQSKEPCIEEIEMPWDKILLPENPKIRHTTTLNFSKRVSASTEPCKCRNIIDGASQRTPIESNKSNTASKFPPRELKTKVPEPPISQINSEPAIGRSKIAKEPQATPLKSNKSCPSCNVCSTKFKTKAPAAITCGDDTYNPSAIKTTIPSKAANKTGTIVTQLSLNTEKPNESKSVTCQFINSSMLSESESKKADAPCANSTCDDRSMPTSKLDGGPYESSATSITSTTVPFKQDIVFQAFKSCEEELKPLRAKLLELQTQLRKLNMPELDCLFTKNAPINIPDRPQTGGTTARTQPSGTQQFCSVPSETMSPCWQTFKRQIQQAQYSKQSTIQDYNRNEISPISHYVGNSRSVPIEDVPGRPQTGGTTARTQPSGTQQFCSLPSETMSSCWQTFKREIQQAHNPQTGDTTARTQPSGTQQFYPLPSETMSSGWQTCPREMQHPQYPTQRTPQDYNRNEISPISHYNGYSRSEDVPDRPQIGGTTARTQLSGTQQFYSLPSETMSSRWQTCPREMQHSQYPAQRTPQDYNINEIRPNSHYICDSRSRPNSGGYAQSRPISGASYSPQNLQSIPVVSQYSSGGWNTMQQQNMQFPGGQKIQCNCSSNNQQTWNSNSRPGTKGNQMPMQPSANGGGKGYYNSRPATTGHPSRPQTFQSPPMEPSTYSDGTNNWNTMQYIPGPTGPQFQWEDMPTEYQVARNPKPRYYQDMSSGTSSGWNTATPRQLKHNCREVPTHDRYKTGPTYSEPDSSGSCSDNGKRVTRRSAAECERSCNSRRPYSQGPPISIELKNIYAAEMQHFLSATPPNDYNTQVPTMPPYQIQSPNSTPYSMQLPSNYNSFRPRQFEAIQLTPYNLDNRYYDNYQPKFVSTRGETRCVCGRPTTSERPQQRNKGIQKSGKRRTPIKKVRVPKSIKPASSTTSNESDGKIVKQCCSKPVKKCSANNTQSSESVCPFIDAIKSILVIDESKMIKVGPYDYSYDSSFFTKKFKNMRLHLRVRPSKKKALKRSSDNVQFDSHL